MSLKRPPTSPMENQSKKDKYHPHETPSEKIVKVEFLSINGKPYFGQISDEELLFIWIEVFNKSRELLFGVKSTKSLNRNIRAIYKLTAPIKIEDEFPSEHFCYENLLGDGKIEKVSARILNYKKVAEIGQLTKITVRTNFSVEPPGIINWLQKYGTVSSKYNFATNKSTGLYTDEFETEIVLQRHIPEFLPMYGQKTTVEYPGIPKACNKCYRTGHLKRDCTNVAREWIKYVVDLIEEDNIPIEFVGSWINAIKKYKESKNAAQ